MRRFLAFTLLLASTTYFVPESVARGGFHGSVGDGAARGSFDRGGFDRSGLDRGNLDRGWGNNGDFGRPLDYGNRPADVPNMQMWNRADNLPTDGGFGRLADRQALPYEDRGTYPMTDAQFRDQAAMIRNGFDNPGYFDRGWWARRDGWWYPGWGDGWAWNYGGWGDVAPFIGMNSGVDPAYYDYGQNILYQNNDVYYGTQPLESQTAYYQQAQDLAQQGTTAPLKPVGKDWKSLGIFTIVKNGQSNSSSLFQLAVNKKGQVKGNYYNNLTDETKQITGALDKKNSRVCWTVAGNKSIVYDTGLGNLMKDQAPLLVHYSGSKTEQYLLVRMKQKNSTG
ncbi:MAG TPA: hypothetical protein V6C97_29180 [Oculatellaceae cyanobacterium]